MQIKRVHVGGWFQRTRLHLGEVYDFMHSADSPLNLDKAKLVELRSQLRITHLEMTVDVLEYILLYTDTGITLRMYEDGLIVLATEHSHDLEADISKLTDYYENKLSPAFGYIFSLGAPVPKELANIKTVYPYFISVSEANEESASSLFADFKQEKYFSIHNDQFDIYRGDKLYIVNQNGVTDEQVQRFIEEQIFLREFRGQMHRYLNMHRIIWEKIAEVIERGKMKGSEIPSFKTKVDQYKKTIDFIDTRINQMGAYLHTRESIANNDGRLKVFEGVLGYKHETLNDTLSYIKDIWVLTQKYVDSAVNIFSDLKAESTNSSVKNLTIVTSMGVGATLIGLFTTNKVPEFTMFGFAYFLILTVIGYSVNKFMKWYYSRRSYDVRVIDIDKNIQ